MLSKGNMGMSMLKKSPSIYLFYILCLVFNKLIVENQNIRLFDTLRLRAWNRNKKYRYFNRNLLKILKPEPYRNNFLIFLRN